MTEWTRNEIVRRWRTGASMRRIARDLHLARKTVRNVLTQHQGQRDGVAKPMTRRGSQLDAHEEFLRELLQRYPDLSVTRVLEELRGRGFTGGYTIVLRRVQQLRPQPVREPVVRFETGPGQQAQMDYAVYDLDFTSEGRQRVYLFSYLLSYSRRPYIRFVEAQDFETTVREHLRAFTHLGGVAATCLYDNMKVVVTRHDAGEPIYNPRFLAFATHYGFCPLACRPRHPQTKGKVERPFHYVEVNLLAGRTFHSRAHLNEVTAWWLEHVADVRIHRETKQRPIDRHAEERPHLIALPAHPYEVAPVVYRAVNVEGFVTYRQNLYSVPWQQLGCLLPVRVLEEELVIYDGRLREIARHRLATRHATGQRIERPEHRPGPDPRQRHALLAERFEAFGECGRRFLEGLVTSQRYGKDQAQRVLGLQTTYTRADLIAALERAVRFGAYSLAAVERILAAQAQPRSPLETLAEEEQRRLDPRLTADPVQPRPTADYQHLFPEETSTDEPIHESFPEPGPGAGPA